WTGRVVPSSTVVVNPWTGHATRYVHVGNPWMGRGVYTRAYNPWVGRPRWGPPPRRVRWESISLDEQPPPQPGRARPPRLSGSFPSLVFTFKDHCSLAIRGP